MWLGFREVEAELSPKFHNHEVGLPADVSVNCTDCPTFGEAGLKEKDAVSVEEGAMNTTWITLCEPDALLTVKVTE